MRISIFALFLPLVLWMPSVILNAAPGDDGPVQHCVLLQFKEGADSAQTMALLNRFARVWEEIPGIEGFQWGTDNSPEGLQQSFTHGFLISFESRAALEAYGPHPAHVAIKEAGKELVEKVFVFDFSVDQLPSPDVPGRVHHLVFFKYKAETTAEKIDEIAGAFSELPKRIPGLLRYQAGPELNGGPRSHGMTHGFVLTFLHEDARDDYLPHPAHKEFVDLVKSHVAGVVVLDFTVRPSGRDLLVTEGLEPFRVYQRDAAGVADFDFQGLASGDGAVESRLLSGRRVVEGFDWQEVGRARAGVFEAKIDNVPTGGEYTVEVRRRDGLGNVAEWTSVSNILVGDIWILAGQSNMEGRGRRVDFEEPDALVHCFTMAQRWELAREPLHWRIDSRDPVHLRGRLDNRDEEARRAVRAEVRKSRTTGVSLGLSFAKEMVRHTGVPIGLIASAHGGTKMEEWDPARRDAGGESLYGSMYRQAQRAGGKVRGVLWYQGESDATAAAVPLFRERLGGLIEAFRRDFNNASLPFYQVQIGRYVTLPGSPAPWKQVQEVQRLIVRDIPHTAVVASVDLSLDDAIHISTAGLKRAGRRLALKARRGVHGDKSVEAGPRLERARLVDRYVVEVTFSGVNGRLSPADRVAGFSLRSADGSMAGTPLYRAQRHPTKDNAVILRFAKPLTESDALWYGAGMDTYCNLVDDEDMAVLAFGPVTVER